MATVSSTFSAVGNSSALFVPKNQMVRIALSNTWVGSVQLQRSNNGGQSWEPLDTYTANGTFLIAPANTDFSYRLACLAYTSGTVTYSLTNQATFNERSKFMTVPVGSVAYSSFGTSTTPVSGTLYIGEVIIKRPMTVTGIGALIGAVGGTDKFIFALYDSAGNLVANTATAGVTVGTANTFQEIALTSVVDVQPGQYFIVVQLNGTTARLRTVAVSTFLDILGGSTTGTFGTIPAAITVPTTLTADTAPIAYVY